MELCWKEKCLCPSASLRHSCRGQPAERLHAAFPSLLPAGSRSVWELERNIPAHLVCEASPESWCANKGLFVCLCSPEQLGRAELCVSLAAPEDRAVLESSPDRAGVSWVWQPRLLVLRSRCFSNKRAQSSLMERFGEGGLDLLIRRCLLDGLGWLSCSGESFLLRLAASGAGSANREDLLLIMLHPSKGGSSSPGDVPSLQLHFVQLQVCSICSVLQLFSSDSPLFFPNHAVPCSHFTSLFHVPLLNLWCLFWDFWCDSL